MKWFCIFGYTGTGTEMKSVAYVVCTIEYILSNLPFGVTDFSQYFWPIVQHSEWWWFGKLQMTMGLQKQNERVIHLTHCLQHIGFP